MLHAATVNVNIKLASLKAVTKTSILPCCRLHWFDLCASYLDIILSRMSRMVSEHVFGHITGHSNLYFFPNGSALGERKEKKKKENTSVALSCLVSFFAAGGLSKV